MSLFRLMMNLAENMEQMALRSSPFYRRGTYHSPFSMIDRLEDEVLNSRRLLDKTYTNKIPKIGKEGFQVSLDVSQFKPSELKVKVVDNDVLVEGEHEERQDENSGYISRRFVQRYHLPRNYDPDKVMSSLSSDGVLTISVPKPAITDKNAKEKLVQIQQTGPAHLHVKENLPEENSVASDSKKEAKASTENSLEQKAFVFWA